MYKRCPYCGHFNAITSEYGIVECEKCGNVFGKGDVPTLSENEKLEQMEANR